MLIKNNKLCAIQLPQNLTSASDHNAQFSFDLKTLVPGVNDVNDEMWKVLLNHPMIKIFLEAGDLEEIKGHEGSKEDAELAAPALSTMNATEAKKVIRETADEDLLIQWLGEDERKSVKDEISKQLKKIEEETQRPPKGDE